MVNEEMVNTVDLSGWTQVGEGGNGTTYICEEKPNVILKVSHQADGTWEHISKEFYTSKAVHDLGIPSPQMIELVRVGDEYGIISEKIPNKQSLARFCGEHPEEIDRLAGRMAELGKQIHQTDVRRTDVPGTKEWIPSMKELMLEALANTRMISSKTLKKTTDFVQSLEDAPTLLHGDFSLGNLIFEIPASNDQMVNGQMVNGLKPYWIDLGRAEHGVPMFDLGHLYLFCNIFSKQKRVQQIAHMTGEQMVQFWNSFALAYNGPEGLDEFTAECKRFAGLAIILLGHIQTLNWHERLFLGLLAKSMFK